MSNFNFKQFFNFYHIILYVYSRKIGIVYLTYFMHTFRNNVIAQVISKKNTNNAISLKNTRNNE